jgi:pyridinium-3,5-bisthiocarboxylic acid mononucleotide nickel chelatase
MRIGYLECFAGLSGDMLLGALVDAGVLPALLQQTTASLNLGATLVFDSIDRSGISARKAHVLVDGGEADAFHNHDGGEADASHHHDGGEADTPHNHVPLHEHDHQHSPSHDHSHSHTHEHSHAHEHKHQHGRNLPAIREILNKAPLPANARALALRAFELLGQAEAAIHNLPLDQVHFHEVGAVDAIVDITCAAVGLTSLNVERWYCSPVNVGSGFVDCAHGRFPVPAPATASLLRGIPTYSEGPAMELVTPTGAALLRALGCEFSRPTAAFEHIGYGAGSRNPARFPNVLRISVGEAVSALDDHTIERETVLGDTDRESIAVLECAIDDLSPQVLAHATQLALEHGALDAMAASVVMKKGRLGTLLTILCRPADAPRFEELLFRETSTLGVRTRTEQRRTLDRTHATVITPYGEIRIKAAALDGVITHAQPEYEDCHARALEHRVPLKQVIDAALQVWHERSDSSAHVSETVTNKSKAAVRE